MVNSPINDLYKELESGRQMNFPINFPINVIWKSWVPPKLGVLFFNFWCVFGPSLCSERITSELPLVFCGKEKQKGAPSYSIMPVLHRFVGK